MKPLSPSAASRWMTCPASHYLSQKLPSLPSSDAANEGTLAHEFAAYALYESLMLVYPDAQSLTPPPPRPEEALATLEMLNGASQYSDAITLELGRHGGALKFGIEIPLESERLRGRADFIALAKDGAVFVVDYKFGGMPVPAHGNKQLGLYALLADRLFGITDNPVNIVGIIQPRATTADFVPMAATWDTPRVQPDDYAPAIDAAYNANENTLCVPSEHCHWCPARSVCLSNVANRLLLAAWIAGDAGNAQMASNEQIGAWLTALKAIDGVADDLSRIAKAKIKNGETIEGWRVSNRKKVDWMIAGETLDEKATLLAEVLEVPKETLIKQTLRTPSDVAKTVPTEKLQKVTTEMTTPFLIASKKS